MATSGENCNYRPVSTKGAYWWPLLQTGLQAYDVEELHHLKHNVLLIIFQEMPISKQFTFAVF